MTKKPIDFNNKMKKLCIIIISILTLSSCKKAEVFDMNQACPECVGEWNWDYTYFVGSDMEDITSHEVEFSLRIDENGRIEFFEDGFLVDIYFVRRYIDRGNRVVNGISFVDRDFVMSGTSSSLSSEYAVVMIIQYSDEFDILATDHRPLRDVSLNSQGTNFTNARHFYERK